MTALMPATPVSFRLVREADTELLLAIYGSTRADELAHVAWDDAQKSAFIRMQFEAQRKFYESEYPGAEFEIIMVAGEPGGRLYVHRREREIRIMDIALLPEFRGRGIGTQILENILAEGACTQRPVTIHVEAFSPAQRLYDRLGFKRVGSNGVYHLLEWRAA
jgi:ribosomal protein S18 acetylase RimI-like enzyme